MDGVGENRPRLLVLTIDRVSLAAHSGRAPEMRQRQALS